VRRLAAGAPCLHREGKACAAVAALVQPVVSLTASQSDALLQAMAIQKASLFSTLLSHWVSCTGETLTPGAGLQVTVSPLTPLIQPQPQVKEWIELFDNTVISQEVQRHKPALATANAIRNPTLDHSPTVAAEESAEQAASRWPASDQRDA
jgi:hypothetical protein